MNTNTEVDAFMEDLTHPFKAEMQMIREIILSTDSRMTETIKWGSPTFMYKGNLATLTPRTKRFVHLFFQSGSIIPNPDGLLEGEADLVRVARFHSKDDIQEKTAALQQIVLAWIQLKDSDT